jgi:hypothetical protein
MYKSSRFTINDVTYLTKAYIVDSSENEPNTKTTADRKILIGKNIISENNETNRIWALCFRGRRLLHSNNNLSLQKMEILVVSYTIKLQFDIRRSISIVVKAVKNILLS